MDDQDEPEIIWEDEPAFFVTKQERDDQNMIQQIIERSNLTNAPKKQKRHKRIVTPDHWKQSKPIVLKAIISALSEFDTTRISKTEMQDALLLVILEKKKSKDAFSQLQKQVLNGVVDMALYFYYPRVYKKVDLAKAMKRILIDGRSASEVYTQNASKLSHTTLISHVDSAYKELSVVLGMEESARLLLQNASIVTYTELKKGLDQENSADASTSKTNKLKRMKSMAAPKIQNVDKIKAMTRKRTSSCLNPTFSKSHSLEKANPKASSQAQSSNRANQKKQQDFGWFDCNNY
uniref:Uncharacterized protein n=1 Tax=Ditylenchus dipsaci TaxID=166011 RepID=A0A915CUY1_9BILA